MGRGRILEGVTTNDRQKPAKTSLRSLRNSVFGHEAREIEGTGSAKE
jgi:hypothetical protein